MRAKAFTLQCTWKNEETFNSFGELTELECFLTRFNCRKKQTNKKKQKNIKECTLSNRLTPGTMQDKFHSCTYLSFVRRYHPNHLRSQML